MFCSRWVSRAFVLPIQCRRIREIPSSGQRNGCLHHVSRTLISSTAYIPHICLQTTVLLAHSPCTHEKMSDTSPSSEPSLPKSGSTIDSILDGYSNSTPDKSGGSSGSKITSSGSSVRAPGTIRTPLLAKRSPYRKPLSIFGDSISFSKSSSYGTSRTGPSRRDLSLEVDIKLRLLPITHLLTKANQTEANIRSARNLAHAALEHAKARRAHPALIGRCCFYVASSHWDPKDTTAAQDAMLWFQRATDASAAGYAEGHWAREWLNYWESKNMSPTTSSRPGTAGSWLGGAVGNVWSFLTSSGSKAKPRSKARNDDEEALSPKSNPHRDTFSSEKSDKTRDHFGLPWSERQPYGKGEVLPGKMHEFVESPIDISPLAYNWGKESYIPNHVLGGMVEAGKLSPAMQRSPTRPSRNSLQYTPDNAMRFGASHTTPGELHIVNGSSPLSSHSLKPRSPEHGKYFPEQSTSPGRNKSVTFATGAETPMQAMERSAYEKRTASEPVGAPRYRRRASITNLSIVAPALEAMNMLSHRRRSELVAQMEQGESPPRPKPHEEALYKRRASDIVEEV